MENNVIIRVDSSPEIGSGHLMRCLALADKLHEKGMQVSFICRELRGNICQLIDEKKHKLFHLPYYGKGAEGDDKSGYLNWLGVSFQKDADETVKVINNKLGSVELLIADHYALNEEWEKSIRPYVKKIMVIDDLEDRKHDCDILLDCNYNTPDKERYVNLIPKYCKLLLGPKYALLRNEFIEARRQLKERTGRVDRILVYYGGADLTNETKKTINGLIQLNRPEIEINVIIGALNKNKINIEKMCSALPNAKCYSHINNMAQIMMSADLFIGAAGITTWERCCLGLPSIVITVANNQVKIIENMAKDDCLYLLGENYKVNDKDICAAVKYMIDHPEVLKSYSLNSIDLVDGTGAERCADLINSINN
ncbi:MAG: UDP-2,4-diacetamido-2,4,6-trideoxy-beta-L-altropyranose hydrolase [Candidatus Saganbacteria bacterium]|nr:UDP-2,4-diacetamido-2,4,6-trideoxy-beta-L-altropyranose hydrolase [Candidatus Saganbacteria bacterium]